MAFGQRLGKSHARAVAASETALLKLRGAVASATLSATLTGAQLAALSAVGVMAHHADKDAGKVTSMLGSLCCRPMAFAAEKARLTVTQVVERITPSQTASRRQT